MGPRAGGPTVVVPAVTVPIEVARTSLDIVRLTEELDAAGVDSQGDSTEPQSIRLRREFIPARRHGRTGVHLLRPHQSEAGCLADDGVGR
jgi:hypothetical protein